MKKFTRITIVLTFIAGGAHYSPDIDLEKLKAAQAEVKKN